jgi:hypothetical protein
MFISTAHPMPFWRILERFVKNGTHINLWLNDLLYNLFAYIEMHTTINAKSKTETV